MKKNLNVVVLIVEIAAIGVLHAVKIKHAEKVDKSKIAAVHESPYKSPAVKPNYILIKLVK